MTSLTDRNIEFVKGLRALADFYESHPAVPLPCAETGTIMTCCFTNKDDFLQAARYLGKSDKAAFGDNFELRHWFSSKVRLDLAIPREQVCEKVVIGFRKVPAFSVPETTEEIVEWKCPDSLFKEDDNADG